MPPNAPDPATGPMTAYARPGTLDQAVAMLARGAGRLLAGGTDTYVSTDARALPWPVIDLSGLTALRGIATGPGGLSIGAGTTWADLGRADLPPSCDALRQAAVQVGGPQIQTVGTIGGNLCTASPAADGVPPLLVLDAAVDLVSVRGTRRLALADFLTGPRRTALAADEVLAAIHLPRAALEGTARFEKLGARAYLVISIAMVAVRLVVRDGRITAAAVAVGSCSATARRLAGVEAALAGPVAGAVSRVADADVAAAVSPLTDIRATAAYRATAAAELIRRAVAGALA